MKAVEMRVVCMSLHVSWTFSKRSLNTQDLPPSSPMYMAIEISLKSTADTIAP